MAQDEYFLALAQMFTQGQARAAESSRMVAADLREQARYEDEKPFREAQLSEMITREKSAKVKLQADEFEQAQREKLGPIDIKKAWEGLKVLKQQRARLEFENQPEKLKAEMDSVVAKGIGDQAHAEFRKLELEDAKDPTLRASRKRATLLQEATEETNNRVAIGKADEFFESKAQRAQIRANEVAESNYRIRALLPPEKLDELNDLELLSKKLGVIGLAQNIEGGDTAQLSALLDVARKGKLLNEGNSELFTQGMQNFIAMKSMALANGASPEAIAEYTSSITQLLTLNAAMVRSGKSDEAEITESATKRALQSIQEMMDKKGFTVDQRLRMISTHADAASNALVISLTNPNGGTDSRATSRPGDAALGGMLTGGADSRNTPPPSGGPSRQNAAFESASRDVRGEEKKAFSERRDADFDKSVIRAIGALQDDERGAFNISKVRKQDAKTTRGYSVLRERLASQLGSEPSDAQFSDYVKSLIAPNILRGPARSVQAYIERLYANAASQ